MIQWIQQRPQWQRILIFVSGVFGAIFFACAISYLVLYATTNSEPRAEALAAVDNVQVREFVTFPDEDAYPVALALAEDGTLYAGSFATGTIWRMSPQGNVEEVAGSRERIGAVSGLAIHEDSLVVLDVGLPLRSADSVIWRIDTDAMPENILDIPVDSRIALNDIAVDTDGNVYLSDIASDVVWQLDTEGNFQTWWEAPLNKGHNPALTGLTYDASQSRLLVIDTAINTIYAVPIDTNETEVLYAKTDPEAFPLYDGIDIGDDGRIFVAAATDNHIIELQNDTTPRILAENFRNSTDVAYDATRSRIYVANSEQRTLLPETFLTVIPVPVNPHLPFALDVIELNAMDAESSE